MASEMRAGACTFIDMVPWPGPEVVLALDSLPRRAGFTGPYCVESNTPEFRNLPVAEAARGAADAAIMVLRSAGVIAS